MVEHSPASPNVPGSILDRFYTGVMDYDEASLMHFTSLVTHKRYGCIGFMWLMDNDIPYSYLKIAGSNHQYMVVHYLGTV